jgi:hypothetical protein
MRTKLFFLLYDSRSGSTYLSALLNRYKGISVSLESAFVSHIIEYRGEVNRDNIDSIVAHLQKEVQFRELGLDMDELKYSLMKSENKFTKKSIIQAIVRQYFSKRDPKAACFIIKHPPYAYLSTVVDLFPDVQFLQIVRDGRAVFNSKRKTTSLSGNKMTTNPLKAAWDWRLKLKRAEKFNDRTMTVFYEDLIRNQEETLQYILKKFNLSAEEKEITKNQADYFQNIGKAQKGLHQNVAKSPQIDAINNWEHELSKAEIKVYNFINREYLQKYDYQIEDSDNKFASSLYAFYFTKFMIEKSKNIILLLKNPSILKLKLNRNYRLLVKK